VSTTTVTHTPWVRVASPYRTIIVTPIPWGLAASTIIGTSIH
jgi:hypothetical protein